MLREEKRLKEEVEVFFADDFFCLAQILPARGLTACCSGSGGLFCRLEGFFSLHIRGTGSILTVCLLSGSIIASQCWILLCGLRQIVSSECPISPL